MMLDAYQPEGVTMLAVDSIFMMPQLGILSTVHPEAATQVFERDCLIKLGSTVAPVGAGKEGETIATVTYRGDSIPAGTKSLAFALVYQAADRTLGEKEIEKAHQKIEGRLRRKTLRLGLGDSSKKALAP